MRLVIYGHFTTLTVFTYLFSRKGKLRPRMERLLWVRHGFVTLGWVEEGVRWPCLFRCGEGGLACARSGMLVRDDMRIVFPSDNASAGKCRRHALEKDAGHDVRLLLVGGEIQLPRQVPALARLDGKSQAAKWTFRLHTEESCSSLWCSEGILWVSDHCLRVGLFFSSERRKGLVPEMGQLAGVRYGTLARVMRILLGQYLRTLESIHFRMQ